MKIASNFAYLCFLTIIIFQSCNKERISGWIDEERLLQADKEPGQWMSLGRNFKQQHYSPLRQINTENIDKLGLAWEYDARSKIGRTPRGLEATPIVIDGIMFTSGAWGVVYALDAKTGSEIWRYDPDVDASYARRVCCDVVNRGVQVWEGKVYVGTLDGYLVCLDASSGAELWKKDTFVDRSRFYTITSPPQVAGEVVVIGNSGAEFGVRGYITAYDLESGEERWRFFIVPGDPEKGFEHPELEMAAKTWDPGSDWESGGGGTAWGQLTYDPELNLLYVGTGNSSVYPIWFRSPKGGDNLFLSSILAINPDNGRLEWYYQTTPAELWDYTATQNMILADLQIDGEMRKVIMQAPKNGFFYVLDRTNGDLISAEKYVTVTWASHIDMETGRPVLTEQAWYKEEPKLIFPSINGGHVWQPMSYSPETGLVYIPVLDMPQIFEAFPTYNFTPGRYNTAIFYNYPPFAEKDTIYTKGQPAAELGEYLTAYDPVDQKIVWQVENPPKHNGGILSTGGGLVFQGAADGFFNVYEARSGKKLHSIQTGTAIMAAPMTYEVDGEQYIAVMAGYGGSQLDSYPPDGIMTKYQNYGRILAFKINGGEVSLPPEVVTEKVPEPPQFNLSEEKIDAGKSLYKTTCYRCHGKPARNNFSGYPNLGIMSRATHQIFSDILLKGALSANGMASFDDLLDKDEVEAIHQYLLSIQEKLYHSDNSNTSKLP